MKTFNIRASKSAEFHFWLYSIYPYCPAPRTRPIFTPQGAMIRVTVDAAPGMPVSADTIAFHGKMAFG